MAIFNTETFQSSANLSLWFKLRSGAPLNLADVPEIIPLRWTYFRDNWATLRRRFVRTAESSFNPDYYRTVLEDFDVFIDQQRLETTKNNPFSGSEIYYRFYPIFDSFLIEQVGLTNDERTLLNNKRIAVKSFSKNDFLKIKRDITAYRDYLADSVGLGDSDYNRIYNRGTVVSSLTPGIADMNLMRVLQEQIGSVDFILANLYAVDSVVDPFALARANANNPDINIGQYSSGYLVKLNYGEDLQGLATRYLKDPNKWIDIAIANGLREPYIDEVGEQLYLLSNGRGNQINLKTDVNKLYINQFIFLQSNTYPFPSQRLITGIKEVPGSGEIVLTLDGEANLDQYLLADEASIRVFKPNTVNSSQFVLIPTTVPLDTTRQDEIPWFLAGAAADEKKTKIDIAIDEAGKLQFAPNGDIALSYGLANAIQAIKLKFMTELGSNRYHPDFGLVNLVGVRNTRESNIRASLVDAINKQIQADSRFDRVESLNVSRVATNTVAYSIELTVRLAGSKTLIPISFAVAI